MSRPSVWSLPTLPAAVLAGVALSVIVSGLTWYRHEHQRLLDEERDQMVAITSLKATLISEWRKEKLAWVEMLSESSSVSRYLEAPRQQREALEGALLEDLHSFVGKRGVSNAAVVDRTGALLLSAHLGLVEFTDLEEAVLERGSITHTAPHRHIGGDSVHLAFGAPVRQRDGGIVGAVLLRVEAEGFLFSIARQWPGSEASGEALLLSFEGDDGVLLSGARLVPHVPLEVHLPPEALLLPGTAAFAPASGTGLDYRGVPVVMALAPVPQTSWMVLAKTDLSEALAPALGNALTTVGIAAGAVLLAVLLLVLWWRRHEAQVLAAERAAAAEQRDHTMLLQNLREAVIATDADQRIRAWNDGAERIFGYAAADALGHLVLERIAPRFSGTTPAEILDRLLREQEVDVSFSATRPDGREVTVEIRLLAHRDPSGQVSGFVGVGRDVTRRRLLERRLQLALEGTGDGLWDLDTSRNRVWVAPAWAARLGLPEEGCEAGEEPAHALFFPSEPEQKRAVQEHLQGLTARYEYEQRLELQGRACWVAVRGKVVEVGADGSPARLAGTFTDVTEKKAFQARLVSTDRLSSMGALAAGMAHEINNPLAYVVSNVAYAHEVMAPAIESGEPLYGPEAQDAMKALLEAVEGAERVRKIVQDLKTFSRADGDEKGLVDVRESLRMALTMARSSTKHRAHVETDFAEVPMVEAAEHRLGQVFLNLVVNAAQAIPEGRGGQDLIRVATRAFGRSVVVEVQDSGCGMSPEVLARLFEPFFTTKPSGTGTGLGLSICHGIVTGMGGRIEVESLPGKGSTFRVVLPASPRAGQATGRTVVAAALPGPAGRILVVDAEERVGQAFRRILSPPHAVVHEASLRDAVARLEAREPFDLVLCDLAAGNGSIDELRATLAIHRPAGSRRLALLSAGACSDGARALLESGLPVIDKPFQPAAVRALVARLLGEAATPPADIAAGALASEAAVVQHEVT